ncbi:MULTISPECIES: hypothetical protein [Pseudomonas]|uniref:hypothetical protein n=1 Tax=Pseudomonadaceae TaxID=135621 RepID=UPI0010F58C5D|nr:MULTISPECIES: hypothetical protein [Pseudomonas]MDE3737371.1 hypothetical protein [Pseudomonas resinovorans]
MKILVRPTTTPQGASWQVCLDQHAVSFRSEAEARRFVSVLEERLKAPHVLPEESRRIAS